MDGTIFICDNLPFLKSLDSESIDLVCIDPPFGKKQTFEGTLKPQLNDDERRIERELMASWDVYDADTAYAKGLEYPDQEGRTAKFADIWSFETRIYKDWLTELEVTCPGAYWLIHATRYTHSDSTAAYIAFMVERMLEIKRVLKPTGSVYVHCDHEANAYLRQMMDGIFGKDNFRNEIVWHYTNRLQRGGNSFGRLHDTLLFYTKSWSWTWNPVRDPDWQPSNTQSKRLERGWETRKGDLIIYDEVKFEKSGVDKSEFNKVYYSQTSQPPIGDVWTLPILNSVAKERVGYPTQKPQALAERIITASTNPGDLVLDCFAGCAYVPVAAQLTGRRWIACDMSPRAWTIVRRQFHKHPKLGIVSEGELPESDTEPDVKLRPQLATANRVIKVRGPDELPQRQTADAPLQTTNVPLTEIKFKQKPEESGEDIWTAFVKKWGTKCWYCDREMSHHRQELHLDHVEPNRHDGSNDDCWNRALACTVCNGIKSDKLTPEQTTRKALEIGLIQTESLCDEVIRGFRDRHDWARLRWETDVKPNRML